MDFLGGIVDYLGLIGTLATGAGGFFGIKSIISGGRAKEVCPLSKNMPPNRLAERCASSSVHWSDSIYISVKIYNYVCY